MVGYIYTNIIGFQNYDLITNNSHFSESVRATRGVRLSEADIKSKISRWLKSAPGKLGKYDSEAESDDSGDNSTID